MVTRFLRWIDESIIDAIVNGTASWTKAVVFGYSEHAKDRRISGGAFLAVGGIISVIASVAVGQSMWSPDATLGSIATAIVMALLCGGLTFFFFWAGAGSFDTYVVDGLVNGAAYLSGFSGRVIRKLQTGRVQTYIIFVVVGVMIFFYMFR
jgi:hypothetical protein